MSACSSGSASGSASAAMNDHRTRRRPTFPLRVLSRAMSRSSPSGASSAASSSPANNGRSFSSFSEIANFLWSVADLLRGAYKQADYGKVILPMTVLRRLDCVLEPTKAKVLAKAEAMKGGKVKEQNLGPDMNRITGVPFHNV